jgi:hypothetical protein
MILPTNCPNRRRRQIEHTLMDEMLFPFEQRVDDIERPERRENEKEVATAVRVIIFVPGRGTGRASSVGGSTQ